MKRNNDLGRFFVEKVGKGKSRLPWALHWYNCHESSTVVAHFKSRQLAGKFCTHMNYIQMPLLEQQKYAKAT